MRRTSRRDAGRPADINHRCALRSSHSSYSGPVQGRLAGRAIAAIDKVAIVLGWRWEKEAQATKLPEFKKRWVSESYPESCPNHARIIPQTSQFWTMVHLQDQNLCFVSSFLRNHSPRATLRLLLLLRKSDNSTLQRHPATAPTRQIQSAHTTLTAAPWSSTLQRHHQPAPERTTLTAAPCSVQQHPSLAPLQHELGTVRTLLAAPWSITPCSSTSRLARQHPQAAPSTRIRSPASPLQSRVYSTHHSDSSTFNHHPQAAPAAAPWAPPASLQTVHTTLTASNTLHQHLAAAFQRHHDARSKAHTPLWQQHAQRQKHASSKALYVWYNCQQLKHFRGKCG